MNEIIGRIDGRGRRFAIVASRFNEVAVDRLVAGAKSCLLEHGVDDGDVDLVVVPGAWELPLAAQAAAKTGRYAGVVALGCVVRGETPHFEFVAGEAARGLARVAQDRDLPVAFGVLTTEDADQAMARAGGRHGNKGWEAAEAVLEMADLLTRLSS